MGGWEIIPFEGLGNLRFGMDRLKIRDLLGGDFDTFRKSRSSQLTDVYDRLGLHLYYDAEDRLQFIEAFPPCDVVYQGVHCLDPDPRATLKRLSDVSVAYEEEVAGFDFPELGFCLYFPENSTEAVSIYRKGYYDKLRGGILETHRE